MMRSRFSRWRVGLMATVVLGMVAGDPRVSAQTAAPPAAADELELDPIRCWWKTDETTVVIGQRFTLALTCGVVETSSVKIVPSRDQLEPTSLELTPYEVVGGRRYEDIQEGPWRYFQYEYTLRLLGNEFFGNDVDIPSIAVTYNIVSTATETEGREQTYVLPALPMRIASLVPKQATDIRDAPHETFGAIEARRFRASSELVMSAVAFGFALLLLGFAVARTAGRFRERGPVAARPPAPSAVLRGCLSAIRQLKSEVARDGWSAERAARALAALRVAAAVALGGTIAQTTVGPDTAEREGQLLLRSGILRRRGMMISAATSRDAVPHGRSTQANARSDAAGRPLLDQIRESLRVFSTARYGRSEQLDEAALTAALDQAERAIRRLRLRHLWPTRMVGAIGRREAAAGVLSWFR